MTPNARTIAVIAAAACIVAACGSAEPTPFRSTSTSTTEAATPRVSIEPSLEGMGDPHAPTLGNGGYDVATYEIMIDVAAETGRLTASTAIEATATEPLATFHLDFGDLRIDAVRVDGADASWDREDEELVVTPAEPLAAGETFTVEVDYGGSPVARPSAMARHDVGWLRTASGTHFVLGDPDGAHHWFPANDHPSDRAAFVIELTVADTLTAAASGELARQVRGIDRTTYRWTVADAPPHLVTVAIGELELVEDDPASERTGIAIRHLLPPDLAAEPPRVLAAVEDMVTFLEQRFGSYPNEAFGIAVVDTDIPPAGAHTWSVLTRSQLTDDQAAVRIVSDLARQWFGSSTAPAAWSEVWLSTSIPTYAGWLWVESRRGEQVVDLIARTARSAVGSSSWPPPDAPEMGNIYVDSVFIHGAAYLHALRLKIGDGAFFDVLGTLHRNHAGGVVTTRDLTDTTRKVTGEPLGFFTDAWLHGDELPGFPDR